MKEIFHLIGAVEVANRIRDLLLVLTKRSSMMAEHLENMDADLKRGKE